MKQRYTAVTYQDEKLGTCIASDIHEAREKLQKRFEFGLIKYRNEYGVMRYVTL